MKKIFYKPYLEKIYSFRRTIFSQLIVITAMMTLSCSSFLDKEPTFIVKENYYTNEEEVNIGLTGIYAILGNEYIYGNFMVYHLSMSDEGVWQRNNALTGPEVYVYDASEIGVRSLWKYLYEGIERANVFLERIDQTNMDEAKKSIAKGEAKFLRAYYYFLLTTNYGSVPLKTTPTYSVNDVDVPGEPLGNLYDFITSEMEEAETMVQSLSAYNHAGRVSKSAVRGILARVYLKMTGAPLNDATKYEDVVKWTNKVIDPTENDYAHALADDYIQIFKDMAADRYNIDESIWEVEFYGNRMGDFEAGRHGNIAGIQFTQPTADTLGYSYGFILGTKKLYDTYGDEDTDVRRDWNISPYAYNNQTGEAVYRDEVENRFSAKFRRNYEVVLPRHQNYTPINFPLLRYADVLLMYAEAKNELNDLNEAGLKVKMIRDRAQANDSTAYITDKESMRQFIRNERFRELAYEGLRKFDLVRWGIFVNTMSALARDIDQNTPQGRKYTAFGPRNVSGRHVLHPIPLDELSLNREIRQNLGW